MILDQPSLSPSDGEIISTVSLFLTRYKHVRSGEILTPDIGHVLNKPN